MKSPDERKILFAEMKKSSNRFLISKKWRRAHLLDTGQPLPARAAGFSFDFQEVSPSNLSGPMTLGDIERILFTPNGPPAPVYARNITADCGTGIGGWSEEQFVLTFKTGMRPDGVKCAGSSME
jgi:hypothetical protein